MLRARASHLVAAFAVAVLAAAPAAGCGGDSTDPTTGVAESTPTTASSTTGDTGATGTIPASGDLEVQTVESAGFAIGVPKSWKSIETDAAASQIEKAAGDNPTLKQIFSVMQQTGTKIRLVAADPKTTGDFATNMNVVVEPLSAGMNLDTYITANRNAITSVLGAEPTIEKVELPGGEAGRFAYTTNRGNQKIRYLQYAFVEDETGYVVTYTTVPATGSKYDELFEESAATFRLL